MYLHTDFVTHLPITEGQKVIVFMIAKREANLRPESASNQSYADKLYEPVTLPFIAHYGDHGDFVLDKEHRDVNSFMWDVSSKHFIKPHSLMPNVITEQTYRELVSDDFADRAIISVTDYESYLETLNHLIDQPIRQGVFTREETYRDAYTQRQSEWVNYGREKQAYIAAHEPMDKYKELEMEMDLMDRFDNLQPLAQPNMLNMGRPDRISPHYRKAQFEMAETSDPSLDFFLNGWGIFQAYLDMIRVPFAPVTGIGGQEAHVDMQIWYAEQITKRVTNVLIDDIQNTILHDMFLDEDEYDEDVPAFVQYYHQLTKDNQTSIINDENELEILEFVCKCSFDQLKTWHSFINN